MNNIKRSAILAFAFVGLTLSAKGQIGKYVNSAYNLVRYSNDAGSIGEAKDDIDKAYNMEGAKENAKMWLVRSMVYSRINANNDTFLRAFKAESGYIAGFSMMQFLKSATAKKVDKEDAVSEMPSSFIACYNESYTALGNKNYAKAIDYYKISLFLLEKLDTATLNNLEKQDVTKKVISDKMALAAYNCTDVKLKIEILQQLANEGSVSPLVIEALSKTYLENKDTALAEKVIREAITRAPDNKMIFQLLINYFVSINRVDRLMEDLTKQIETNPQSSWYYSRGVLNEQNKEYDKAIADYKMAIELEELNYDANNNLGRLLLLHIGSQLRDKKMVASGAARKAADAELQDLYKLATKYLEVAAENTQGYSADELIGLHKTLKNVALEMGNQAEADRHDAMIKALELAKTQN